MISFKKGSSLILTAIALPLLGQTDTAQMLPTLYIDAQQTANLLPVATYESPISNLEFEPRVDLQSRGMAEAQGDVTVRGGIFENTGFRVGSATLIDPQTGHYFAELPIAPEMLDSVKVLTGTENALYGFNSSVGTLSYSWSQISDGGSLTVGGGDHDLNFQRIHHGQTGMLGENGDWSWGLEAEVSRSESDGTIEYGDHDFNRTTGRLQILGPNSQTDFFAGYQSKFFGWPELYAAPYGANETENLKTRLFIINHRQEYDENSYWEATGYTRRHSDHYVFNRFSPDDAYIHETEVHAFALAGKHAFSSVFALNYTTQFTADEIESTTLEHSFTSRSYFKASLMPEYRMQLNEIDTLTVRAGASFDDTNRNPSSISPAFDITWQRTHGNGNSDSAYLSFTESSQVAGYTAIGGRTAFGQLFASDPDLDRESSQNLELGLKLTRNDWSFEGAIFYRWDDDLVDWTYSNLSPSARTANNVDLETFGVELIGTKHWGNVEGILSYTFLTKDENYGDANIDASFYALNYATHRVTLGAIWRPIDMLEVRIDNEWRENEDNALRNSSDTALFTNLSLSLYPPQIEDLELFFAIDNAWDDDFEDVPGTPGRGDQYSAGMTYRW
ncbi:TonB-dependent receptor [Coraliomargarita sp. SDUM461004]|uniref:TonB-dependent receptor n=1 Tax=Thalassobacterium sedimentorum TaxID=3041258 RepID=A0ABU1AEC0_9BACT|nr:TonB-dependent receptor [Coraliomargarita sp. SDUM461004]MDQ8193115.1 TonB-dependent receptor [Coraliomargarita sp. SDUM461004]